MIITCEECSTKFNLDDKLVKGTGSKVRCSQCGNVFVAYPAAQTAEDLASADDSQTGVPESASDVAEKHQGLAPKEAPPTPDTDSLDPDSQFDDKLEIPDATEEKGISEKPEEEFDFSEIDDALDDQLATGSEADSEDLPKDMELDLEDETSDGTIDIGKEIEDELDISDLSGLLDEEEGDKESEEVSDLLEDDLELELELDSEGDAQTEPSTSSAETLKIDEIEVPLETKGNEEEALDIGDLDLDLELEEESVEAEAHDQKKSHQVSTDELDLSDLENILEIDEAPADEMPEEEPADDIELSLDADILAEEQISLEDEIQIDEVDEELDLSDIEEMLGATEAEDTKDSASEEFELELDLLEEERKASGEKKATASEMSSNVLAADDAPPKIEDFDLEFESLDSIEEATPETVTPEPEVAKAQEEEEIVEEKIDTPPPLPAEIAPEKAPISPIEDEEDKAPATKKKGVGLPVLLLFLVVLLAGGVYYMHQYMGINIPYVSDFLTPQEADKGNQKIKTLEINSEFVDNEKAGKLFVITGKVKNDYAKPRSFIRISGKIFQKGKKLYQTQIVYPGNVIADLQLVNMDETAIKKRLSNRFGDNRSNVKLAPGRTLPFMIVFFNIPDNLEEFTIEVVESSE
jgi:predicted Zn finger-like uncharacterized protein